MDYVITICSVTGSEVDVAKFSRRHFTPYSDDRERAFFNFSTIFPHPGFYEWGAGSSGHDYELRRREHGIMEFLFASALAFPEPIFRRLAVMYPGLVFDVLVYDEIWDFERTAQGEFNGKNDFRAIDRAEIMLRSAFRRPQ